MNEEEVAAEAVDAAIAIHKALGPGLLESAYVAALEIEFAERGLTFAREVPILNFFAPLMKQGIKRLINRP